MADAATLTRLDLRHRGQQAELAARVARLIQGYWLVVEPDNLSGPGGAQWLRQSVAAVQAGRRSSILLASAYTELTHQLQQPGSPRLELPQVPDAAPEQLYRSLAYTGLGKAAVDLSKIPQGPQEGLTKEEREAFERSEAMRERREKFVMDQAITAAAKSAVKLVVNGGRDLTDQLFVTKTAIGYTRVTQSDNPCGFCLALASRGPVYEDDSFDESDPRFTGPGDHKVHDGCCCILRPTFTRGEKNWPEQARKADELWRTHGTAKDGRSAMENFRAEARRRGLADLNRW